MKTRHGKNFLWITMLLLIGIVATSSVKPGYDENGEDINECALYNPCPEGYMCKNLLGSYLCEGLDIELDLCESSASGSGFAYCVYGKCIGINGFCEAKCVSCWRRYRALIGKAYDVNGVCICGGTNFIAL